MHCETIPFGEGLIFVGHFVKYPEWRMHGGIGGIMKKLILAGICMALGVVLSTTFIPVGPARIFPFQHMINVLLAVLVGSRYAVGAAFGTSCLRNILALGSPLAFPGSMIGAWLSSVLYKRYNAIWAAALGEAIGTGLIGAIVSYPAANFLLGKPLSLLTLIISFFMSSVAGACIGFAVLQILFRRNILHKEA